MYIITRFLYINWNNINQNTNNATIAYLNMKTIKQLSMSNNKLLSN